MLSAKKTPKAIDAAIARCFIESAEMRCLICKGVVHVERLEGGTEYSYASPRIVPPDNDAASCKIAFFGVNPVSRERAES